MPDATSFQCIVKRNIMGGGNVIVLPANVGPLYGGIFHVASYATLSNARRGDAAIDEAVFECGFYVPADPLVIVSR